MAVARLPRAYLDRRWWPASVRERVQAVVPESVLVVVREDPLRYAMTVELVESRRRRMARRLGVERMSRAGVIARVACELADSPAGLAILTRWA